MTVEKGPGPNIRPRSPAPTKQCPEELKAANATLQKSREIADTIVGPGAKSDLPYWFARLYQYITQYEIAAINFSYPCFVLHFIPIFYDTYRLAAEAFMKRGEIPSHWREHFAMASLIVDPSQPVPYGNAVTRCLISGVTAHITGDMAPSLVNAYRSFSTKYLSVPPFDTYKPDFFDRSSTELFEQVRVTLINEFVNRGLGLAAMGKSIDPGLASTGAALIKAGLNTKEIFRWREVAWQKAKLNLERPK
jgi:hypothetical protein